MYQPFLHAITLAAAVSAAAAMGYSIQRGGTCMVAAVDQLVGNRSPGKLVALAECSLWTAALGIAAMALGLGFKASPAYLVGTTTVLGGMLLGLGAWINQACVFGSIARIGGRDWHYLLTPPGYFLGSLVHAALIGGFAHSFDRASGGSHLVPLGLLLAGSALASGRSLFALRKQGRSPAELWNHRHATIAIGFCFVALAVIAGPWTYTEALGRAAHGGGWPGWQTLFLFAALLAGAIIGGRGLPGPAALNLRRATACLAGGALMGFGGSLVPGGNDNLILVGLPALQPHAWLAIAAMVVAIAAGLYGSRLASKLRFAWTQGRAIPD